jgi:PEGA domain-containing protein
VTSTPEGATITVGGKVVGITPTTIKLPAFAPTTITLTKEGFLPDTQKLAPRANNVAHSVTLKKRQKLR